MGFVSVALPERALAAESDVGTLAGFWMGSTTGVDSFLLDMPAVVSSEVAFREGRGGKKKRRLIVGQLSSSVRDSVAPRGYCVKAELHYALHYALSTLYEACKPAVKVT